MILPEIFLSLILRLFIKTILLQISQYILPKHRVNKGIPLPLTIVMTDVSNIDDDALIPNCRIQGNLYC